MTGVTFVSDYSLTNTDDAGDISIMLYYSSYTNSVDLSYYSGYNAYEYNGWFKYTFDDGSEIYYDE